MINKGKFTKNSTFIENYMFGLFLKYSFKLLKECVEENLEEK
jgi:hypothetical protein